MAAGKLKRPVKVERKAAGTDRFGRDGGGWAILVPRLFAAVTPKQGGETSLAGRLQSRQAWELLIRRSPETEAIRASDRFVDLAGQVLRTYEVRSIAPYQADPAFLLVTAESDG